MVVQANQHVKFRISPLSPRLTALHPASTRRRTIRTSLTGVGPVAISAPRVNDRRVVDGARQKFTSANLPPCVWRSPRVESVLTALYLQVPHGPVPRQLDVRPTLRRRPSRPGAAGARTPAQAGVSPTPLQGFL
jgi:hypothetical protein